MPTQGGNPVKSPMDEVYFVVGSIYGGGTAPTARLIRGATFSRGGTGKITVLPDVNYPFMASAQAELVVPTNIGYQANVLGYYNGATSGFAGHTAGSTAYVTFQVVAGGASGANAVAVDLVAGEELQFTIAFVRSLKP